MLKGWLWVCGEREREREVERGDRIVEGKGVVTRVCLGRRTRANRKEGEARRIGARMSKQTDCKVGVNGT